MPRIDYTAKLQVLAAVRGHRFDRTSFDRLFEDMADISVTVVDQPAAALLMTPDALAHFDAVLLYDMPGMVDVEGWASPEPSAAGTTVVLDDGELGYVLIVVVAGAEPEKSTGPFFPDVVVFYGHRPQFLPTVPSGV